MVFFKCNRSGFRVGWEGDILPRGPQSRPSLVTVTTSVTVTMTCPRSPLHLLTLSRGFAPAQRTAPEEFPRTAPWFDRVPWLKRASSVWQGTRGEAGQQVCGRAPGVRPGINCMAGHQPRQGTSCVRAIHGAAQKVWV
eukprot:364951-Chlamydomonas_euryale.AAC.6